MLTVADHQTQHIPISSTWFVRWSPDSRRIVGEQYNPFAIWTYDVEQRRHLGTKFPFVSDNQGVTIGPDGHYRGSWRIDEHLVYVALTDDGRQETYTPADFQVRLEERPVEGDPAGQDYPARRSPKAQREARSRTEAAACREGAAQTLGREREAAGTQASRPNCQAAGRGNTEARAS